MSRSKNKRGGQPSLIKRWAIEQLTSRAIPLPSGFASWWSVKDEKIAGALGYPGKAAMDAAYVEARRVGWKWKQAARTSTWRQTAKQSAADSKRFSVASDDFLHTYEWRRLRMEAIKKYGARCQCCGASPETGATMNVDHIKPRRLFPALALDLDNLQVLCHECNHGKGNWDMTDWRQSVNA